MHTAAMSTQFGAQIGTTSVCKFQKMGCKSGTLLRHFHHLPWKTLKQVAVLQSAAFQHDKHPVLYMMFNVTHHKERCK